MSTTIITKQNDPAEIKKLRAQRHLYAQAKRVFGLQVVVTSVLPVAGAIAVLFWSPLKGSLAFYGILISILDVAVLETWQKKMRTNAAKIQEAFDCDVLDLPWDEMRVGSRPEAEDIQAASSAYMGGRDDAKLRDWYPQAVGEVPISLGRIICQRANLRWDAQLRRRYRTWLAVILMTLGLVVAIVGLRNGSSLEELAVGVLAPIAPMILWGIREFKRHGEAADISDRLREKSFALWMAALKKDLADEDLRASARQMQSEIYSRRVSAPMIFDWIYGTLRSAGEEQMNVAAIELVREAKSHGFTDQGERPRFS